MVLKLNYVLYVVAEPTDVINCLLVEFNQEDLDCYEQILTDYADTHLQPLYDSEKKVKASDLREVYLSQGKYKVEPETVLVSLALWHALNDSVEKYCGPVPPLAAILPRIISWWNASKSMVDVMSRYLKNVRVNIGNATPALVLIIRYMSVFAVNACITTKLLDHGRAYIAGNGARSYRGFKHAVANKLPLKDVFAELGKKFSLPLRAKGGHDEGNKRAEFSPAKRRRGGTDGDPNPLFPELDSSLMQMYLQSVLPEIMKKRHRAREFHNSDIASQVRWSRGERHWVLRVFEEKEEEPMVTRQRTAVTPGSSTAKKKKKKNKEVGTPRRLACVLCGVDTTTRCIVCKVHLCADTQPDREACCQIFHDPTKDIGEIYDQLRQK